MYWQSAKSEAEISLTAGYSGLNSFRMYFVRSMYFCSHVIIKQILFGLTNMKALQYRLTISTHLEFLIIRNKPKGCVDTFKERI